MYREGAARGAVPEIAVRPRSSYVAHFRKEVSMGKYGMTAITILALAVLGWFIFRPI